VWSQTTLGAELKHSSRKPFDTPRTTPTAWSIALFQTLISTYLVKIFPAFCERFIAVFRRPHPPMVPVLTQMNPFRTFPHCPPKIHSNIILPSTPWSSKWSLPFRFCNQIFVCILISPIRATCPPEEPYLPLSTSSLVVPNSPLSTLCWAAGIRFPAQAVKGFSSLRNRVQTGLLSNG